MPSSPDAEATSAAGRVPPRVREMGEVGGWTESQIANLPIEHFFINADLPFLSSFSTTLDLVLLLLPSY